MREDLVALLSELVSIDSVNPSLVPGGAGEAEIAVHIVGWAGRAGLDAHLLEETPGRPSVIVRASGTGGGKTLLLCGHIDTVNTEGMSGAHSPRIEGDRLYGRGAYDMKAGVAAALLACREAAGLELAGDVVVAAVADEEHASFGVQQSLRQLSADAAVVTEPTELEIAVAHKGFVWAEIEITGVAAHGSRPHLGLDAIVKAGPILTALGELDAALGERQHPLLGRGSVHASTISGGVELSSYPERCVIGLERRTLPGETAADIEAELSGLLERCRAADPQLEAELRMGLVREPFEVDQGEGIVAALAAAANGSRISGASYWADSAFIAGAGIPTVLFGPAGEGAHAQVEWVSIDSTETVARTLVDLASTICG
jgi:acetylornithine deacetylase